MDEGLSVETLAWRDVAPESAPDDRVVDLWCVRSGDSRFDDERFFDCLSEGERDRASRFRFERDRRSYRVSHACKRHVLSRYVGLSPAELGFSAGEWGKPRLCGPGPDSEWEFNLSHSKGVTLLGVSRGFELGVDVEGWQTTERMEPIFKRFGSEAEKESFDAVSGVERASLLTGWWVSKEAFIKAIGRGLSQALSEFSIQPLVAGRWTLGEVPSEYGAGCDYQLQLISIAPGHLGAVVGRVPSMTLRGFHFESVWADTATD